MKTDELCFPAPYSSYVSVYVTVSYTHLVEQKPEQKPQGDAKNLYRVQLGAFEKKDNATAFAAKLKKEGFDTYIVQIGQYYNCLLYTSRCV